MISSIPFPLLKNLADFIPGFPFKAATSIPESSAKTMVLSSFDKKDAFLNAFSKNVFPFSLTSNHFGANFIFMVFSFFDLSLWSILFISSNLFLFVEAK